MRYISIIFLFFVLLLPVFYITGYGLSSAELDRSASVNVDSDINGVIRITANQSYDIISADPQLSIDFSQVPAESINRNSSLKLGNQTDPNQNPAFTVQNASTEDISLTFTLSSNPSFDGNQSDVIYTVTDSATTQELSVGNSATYTLQPGETIDFSIRLVTDQSTTSLSTTFSISGSDPNA